jgi:hypothetical protein
VSQERRGGRKKKKKRNGGNPRRAPDGERGMAMDFKTGSFRDNRMRF